MSCNLVDPFVVGPAQVYDAVGRLAEQAGTSVARAELVGLAPEGVVDAVPPARAGPRSTSIRIAPSRRAWHDPVLS